MNMVTFKVEMKVGHPKVMHFIHVQFKKIWRKLRFKWKLQTCWKAINLCWGVWIPRHAGSKYPHNQTDFLEHKSKSHPLSAYSTFTNFASRGMTRRIKHSIPFDIDIFPTKPATAGSIQLDRSLKILIIVSKQRIILLLLDQVELFKTPVFLNAATSNSTAALNSSVLLIDVFVNFRFLSHAFTSCSFSRNLSTFIITKKHELQYSTDFPWYCQNVSKYSMHCLHFSEKITKCFWAIIDICHCFKHSKRTVIANQLSSLCPSESSSWSSESSLPMTDDGGDYIGARQNTGVVIA